MAPLDRGPQRLLAGRRIARTARQQRQAAFQPSEQLLGREHPDARCGELDRERQPVEATADLGDVLVELETGAHRAGTLREHRYGVALRQRRHLVLVLCRDSKRGATRHEQAQVGTSCEELGHGRRSRQELLEVVEQ